MGHSSLFNFDYLISKEKQGFFLIGIDEVGRGALAGPVISCAFTWKKKITKEINDPLLLQINDSKKLNSKIRNEIFNIISKYGCFGLGYASVLEIEKLNILNATFLSMKRAFDSLLEKLMNGKKRLLFSRLQSYLLIDGNKKNPYIKCPQTAIIDGDEKSSLIAAASIVAKVYRDTLMEKISRLESNKKYSWQTNVGYGTKHHKKTIKDYGLTPFHRKLFVRKILEEETIAQQKISL